MKRFTAFFLVFAMLFLLESCGKETGKTAEVKIDYGNSSLYTTDEMDDAIAEIYKRFAEFDGCELHSLTFAGDEKCVSELSYCNSLGDTEVYTQCIVFESSFHSPKDGGECWNADYEYTAWLWYLARTDGGKWTFLTSGY